VAGETGYFTRLSFASRRDWPELNSVVKKALDQVSPDEKKAILAGWIHLEEKSFFNSSEFLSILSISLFPIVSILMLILVWRYYQRKFLQFYPEERAASFNIVFFVALMFIVLGVFVILDEYLGIPHLIFGAPETPVNYREALFETILIYLLGAATVLLLIRSINVHRRDEAALLESEARYRLLAENVADLIWTTDLDLRFTYVSPSVFTLMGYTPEEFKDMPIDRILSPASLELGYRELEKETALEASGQADPNRTRTLEVEQIRKDGSVVWVEMKMSGLRDPDGRLTGILGVTRDITDRKIAEDELKASNQELLNQTQELSRMATVVKDSNDAITIQDLEGNITAWNTGATQTYGYSEQEALKKNVASLVPNQFKDEALKFIDSLKKGDLVESLETKRQTKDGKILDIWMVVTKLVDNDGKLIGVATT